MSQFSSADFGRYGIDVPNGRGDKKVRCPKCADDKKERNRKDLSVNVDKGVWQCWSCGWKGSVMGGIPNTRPTFRPVEAPPTRNPTPVDDRAKSWLEHMRGIPAEAVEQVWELYGLSAQAATDYETTNRVRVLFPFQAEGATWAFKQRFEPPMEGMPKMLWCKVPDAAGNSTAFRKPLFGHHLLEGEAAPQAVLLTEGELDAVALAAIEPKHQGQPCAACSVGNAPSTNHWRGVDIPGLYESQAELRKEGRYFLLAMDNDRAGRPFRDEVARRLGLHRCWVVIWPEGCKDANDVLKQHGAGRLQQCIDEATRWPLEDVKTASDALPDLLHIREYGYPVAAGTGMKELDRIIRLAAGQFWVWTGVPTHGKSNMLEFFAVLNSVANGTKWAFYSPETPKTMFYHRLTEILMGRPMLLHTPDGEPVPDPLSEEELLHANAFLNEHFYYIEPADEATENSVEWVLAQGKELVMRHGVDSLVMDPWNGMSHQYDSWEETRYISNRLEEVRAFRRQHDVSVHIVAHPKKIQYVPITKHDPKVTEQRPSIPGAYDIAGSSTWYDKADMIVVQYRFFHAQHPDTGETIQQARSMTKVEKVKFPWWGKQATAIWDYDAKGSTRNNRFLPSPWSAFQPAVPDDGSYNRRSWLPPSEGGQWLYRSPFGGPPAAPNSGAAGPAFRPGQADSIVDSFTPPEADADGDFNAPF